MRYHRFLILATAIAVLLGMGSSSQSATRYAGEFLSLGVGARVLAMGSTFVALSDDATAGYWNPAGMPRLKRGEAMLQHSERFAGIVKNDFASCVVPGKRVHGFGVSLVRVGVDDIKYTALEDPSKPLSSLNRPRVSKVRSNVDYALFLSYGRFIRADLSVGTSLKVIRRNIGNNTAFGYGIDLGVLYAPIWGFSFGLNVCDATSTTVVWDTGAKDVILPSLRLGVAYSRAIPLLSSRMIGAVGSQIGADVPERDRSLNAGVEYWYRSLVALRLGSQMGQLTAGAGLRLYDRLGIDYAFLQHEDLDNTHRVSLSVWF